MQIFTFPTETFHSDIFSSVRPAKMQTYSFKISWVIDFALWNHMEFAKSFLKHFTVECHIYIYLNFPKLHY